jgi:hypothetical protein
LLLADTACAMLLDGTQSDAGRPDGVWQPEQAGLRHWLY